MLCSNIYSWQNRQKYKLTKTLSWLPHEEFYTQSGALFQSDELIDINSSVAKFWLVHECMSDYCLLQTSEKSTSGGKAYCEIIQPVLTLVFSSDDRTTLNEKTHFRGSSSTSPTALSYDKISCLGNKKQQGFQPSYLSFFLSPDCISPRWGEGNKKKET